MTTKSSGRRGRLSGPLAGLAALLAVLALVLSYLGRAVLQAQPFADRAVAALKSPAVQDDFADHLTDAVVRQTGGNLAVVRTVRRLQTIAWALAAGSILLALLALWLSRDRRSTAQHLGIGLALGERIRHRVPNLIAVDFYRQGDVLGVVRALNGLSP